MDEEELVRILKEGKIDRTPRDVDISLEEEVYRSLSQNKSRPQTAQNKRSSRGTSARVRTISKEESTDLDDILPHRTTTSPRDESRPISAKKKGTELEEEATDLEDENIFSLRPGTAAKQKFEPRGISAKKRKGPESVIHTHSTEGSSYHPSWTPEPTFGETSRPQTAQNNRESRATSARKRKGQVPAIHTDQSSWTPELKLGETSRPQTAQNNRQFIDGKKETPEQPQPKQLKPKQPDGIVPGQKISFGQKVDPQAAKAPHQPENSEKVIKSTGGDSSEQKGSSKQESWKKASFLDSHDHESPSQPIQTAKQTQIFSFMASNSALKEQVSLAQIENPAPSTSPNMFDVGQVKHVVEDPKSDSVDEDSDEYNEGSMIGITFHAAIRQQECPDTGLGIVFTYHDLKGSQSKRKQYDLYPINQKRFGECDTIIFFERKLKLPADDIRSIPNIPYKYTTKGLPHYINLNWEKNKPDPLPHHYDGLITKLGLSEVMDAVKRVILHMLPNWAELQGSGQSHGMLAATFMQHISQVHRHSVSLQIRERGNVADVYEKYIGKLITLQGKSKKADGRMIVSTLIALYLRMTHSVKLNDEMVRSFSNCLTVQPNSEWMKMFKDIEHIHFSFEHTKNMFTQAVRSFTQLQIERFHVYDVLKVISFLHFLDNDKYVEGGSAAYIDCKWWGLRVKQGNLVSLQKHFTKRNKLNKEELKFLIRVSEFNPLLISVMVAVLPADTIQKFADHVPLDVMLAKWWILVSSDVTDGCTEMRSLIVDKMKEKEIRLNMEQACILGDSGLKTLELFGIKSFKTDLYFCEVFFQCIISCPGSEEYARYYIERYAKMFKSCIREAIRSDYQKFLQTQNFWSLVFLVDIKNEEYKALWDRSFSTLFERVINELSPIDVANWYCSSEGYEVVTSLNQESSEFMTHKIEYICLQTKYHSGILNRFENNHEGVAVNRRNILELCMLFLDAWVCEKNTKNYSDPAVYFLLSNSDGIFMRILMLVEVLVKAKEIKQSTEMKNVTSELEMEVSALANGSMVITRVAALVQEKKVFLRMCKHFNNFSWSDINTEAVHDLLLASSKVLSKIKAIRKLLLEIEPLFEIIKPVNSDIFERNHQFQRKKFQLNEIVDWPVDDVKEICVKVFDLKDDVLTMCKEMQKQHFPVSMIFCKMWQQSKQKWDEKSTEQRSISMKEVVTDIWHVTVHTWEQIKHDLTTGNIEIKRVKDYFAEFKGNEERLIHELELMKLNKDTTVRKKMDTLFRLMNIQEILKILNELRATFHLMFQIEALESMQIDEETTFSEMEEVEGYLKDFETLLEGYRFSEFEAVTQYIKSKNVVGWLQDNVGNEKELKTLMALAMASVRGHGAIDVQRAQCLPSVINGYSPFLFHLKPRKQMTFQDVLIACKEVFQNKKKDPNMCKNLEILNSHLPWLKNIRGSHGSDISNELDHVSFILNSSDISFGMTLPVAVPNLDDLITVKVINRDNHTEQLNFSELKDIQSKVVLVVGSGDSEDDVEDRMLIETYQEIVEHLETIGNVYVKLVRNGNLCFTNFKMKVINRKAEQSTMSVELGNTKTITENCSKDELCDYMGIVAELLECSLKCWNYHFETMRTDFYFLNFLEIKQITILRTILAQDSRSRLEIKDYFMLGAVRPFCEYKHVKAAVAKAKDLVKKSEVIQSESDYYFRHMTERRQNNDEFENDFRIICKDKCDDFDRDKRGYRSLVFIGYFLQELALADIDVKDELWNIERIHSFAKGEPNLIMCPYEEMIKTVLSLYKQSVPPEVHELPSANEVLYCTENTSVEEVSMLWHRAINIKAVNNLYCLVNADELPFDVADKVLKMLEYKKNTKCGYQLAIICSIDGNTHTHVQTSLEIYHRNFATEDDTIIKTFISSGLKKHGNSMDFERCSVRVITSSRAGMGKSMKIQNNVPKNGHYIKLPISGNSINEHQVAANLLEAYSTIKNPSEVVIHLDIHHEVYQKIDRLLFMLTILGRLSTIEGYMWQMSPNQYYLIENVPVILESKKQKPRYVLQMLAFLPSSTCHSPAEVMQVKESDRIQGDQYIDENAFALYNTAVWYLQQIDNLSPIIFSHPVGNVIPMEGLHVAMRHSGITGCSWGEIHNFLAFLKVQIHDCSQSSFCLISDSNDQDLPLFGDFAFKFVKDMSKDFATRSLEISEQSVKFSKGTSQDLQGFQLKRKWEDSPHPYLFFNEDRTTFSFMGFCIDPQTLDLKDPTSGNILQRAVLQKTLFDGLCRNGVNLHESFEAKNRDSKLDTLHKIIGGKSNSDPDPTFVLTTDNVKKILAIHMRFRCGIPVVIMGETGCGKTRLVKFLCSLQSSCKSNEMPDNLIIVKVHGGTTRKHICTAVKKAILQSQENNTMTVLFFDEANTTNEIGLLKEIICDTTMEGKSIACENLKIVAAVNPYRRHSAEMIEKLKQAGLGYHVSADETQEKLGTIPMRELVYRVHPLPETMMHLVWDFGQLDEINERTYIDRMVTKTLQSLHIQKEAIDVVTNILAKSQSYMRRQKEECKFVSLRDVERALTVFAYFYSKRNGELFHLMDAKHQKDDTIPSPLTRSVILALGVCYIASLSDKNAYVTEISPYFTKPCTIPEGNKLSIEIRICYDVFMDNIDFDPSIAKNQSLRENIFMMIICIELRIPLFLVGRPGSSKSLAKTIVMDIMQGTMSKTKLFQSFKEIQVLSYQCSPMSTPEGIVNVFNQSASLQKNRDLEKYSGVVVLDEVGLAEDSPKMPLKSLHPLLEDGCEGHEKAEPHKKVAFIGISNWALDPAKMNRGILLHRNVPTVDELKRTASQIGHGFSSVRGQLSHLYSAMSEAYMEIYNQSSERKEFFGLRDFYSLLKMILSSVKKFQRDPIWDDIQYAVLRNFGGLESVNPVEVFRQKVQDVIPNTDDKLSVSDFDLIKAGLKGEGLEGVQSISRYTLIMVENLGALDILQSYFMDDDTVIMFGSSFPKDQEYTQICRNINRIKICMESGKNVILLNLDNLYESLYDCLNQYYIELGGDKFVDLGLGTHRIKCKVHKDFRLTLVAEKRVVYETYPIALVNRLEKHFLLTNSIMESWQLEIIESIKQWMKLFIDVKGKSREIEIEEVFIGYHEDAVATTLLQIFNSSNVDMTSEKIKMSCKEKLLQCATPDGILRLPLTALKDEEKEWTEIYFQKQHHENITQLICHGLSDENEEFITMVTTHSHVLVYTSLPKIKETVDENIDIVLLSLHEFDTEHQFRKTLRKEYSESKGQTTVFLIQCENGHYYQNLVASARYAMWDEFQKMNKENKRVLMYFIIQLPRRSETNFSGFPGGRWIVCHIDELMEMGKQMNFALVKATGICELLKAACDDNTILDFNQLLIDTLYKSAGNIIERQCEINRKIERTHILVRALKENGPFANTVKGRVVKLLKQKHEYIKRKAGGINIEEWLHKKVCHIDHITQQSTLRVAIWNHLMKEIECIVTGLVIYMDADLNLNFVKPDSELTFLYDLWNDMFAEDQATKLDYEEMFLSTSEDTTTELQRFQAKSNSASGIDFSAIFPFSAVVYTYVEILLKQPDLVSEDINEVENILGQRFVEFPVGKVIEKACEHISATTLTHQYVDDFLYIAYKPSASYTALEYKILKEAIRKETGYNNIIEVHLFFKKNSVDIANFKMLMECTRSTSEDIDTYLTKKFRENREICLGKLMMDFLLKELSPQKGTSQFHDWAMQVDHCAIPIETLLIESDHHTMLKWKKILLLKSYVKNVSPYFPKPEQNIHSFWKVMQKEKREGIEYLHEMVEYLNGELRLQIMNANVEVTVKLLGKLKGCVQCCQCAYHPVELSCEHTFCKACLQNNVVIDEKGHACPKCKKNYTNKVFDSKINKSMMALHKQQTDLRRKCQMFFSYFLHEFIFEFALKQRVSNLIETVKLLMSLFTHQNLVNVLADLPEKGDVIRGVILKNLFKLRYNETTKLLTDWLKKLAKNPGKNQHEVQYNRKGVVLVCHYLEEGELAKIEKGLPENIKHHLSECVNAIKEYLPKSGKDISFQSLQAAAYLRVALMEVAEQLYNSVINRISITRDWTRILENIEEICSDKTYPGHYLARYIFRRHGMAALGTICGEYPWVFQQTDNTPDQYVLVSKEYSKCKAEVTNSLIHGQPIKLNMVNKYTYEYLLAVSREVIIETIKRNDPSTEQMNIHTIVSFFQQNRGLKVLNPQLWASYIQKRPMDILPERKMDGEDILQILGLILHMIVVSDSSTCSLILPLKQIAFNPECTRQYYLPGMPEDEIYRQVQAVLQIKKESLILYTCPNGHPYFIGECGRPWEERKCLECSSKIGGIRHKANTGNNVATWSDKTERGYCLETKLMDVKPSVRNLSHLETCIVRLLVHLAMYIGAVDQPMVIHQMIRGSTENKIKTRLWNHIENNISDMQKLLQKNKDDTCLLMHLILKDLHKYSAPWKGNLTTKEDRENWEKHFQTVTEKIFRNTGQKLNEAHNIILNEEKQGTASQMMMLLHEMGQQQTGTLCNPFEMPEIWGYRVHVSVNHMITELKSLNLPNLKILILFCKKIDEIQCLKFIPGIMRLQDKLVKKFHLICNAREADKKTVSDFLRTIENEQEHRDYEEMFEAFINLWNTLRKHLENFAFNIRKGEYPIRLDKKYCDEECSLSTSISTFIPNFNGPGRCSLALIQYLISIQNDLLTEYCKLSHEQMKRTEVNARNIAAIHVINFTLENDLDPIVHANALFSMEPGKGLNLTHDFENIQTEVTERYLRSKSELVPQLELVTYREDYQTDNARLLKLESLITQETIDMEKRQLQSECQRLILVDFNSILHVLDIALGYAVSLGITDDMQQISLQEFINIKLQIDEPVIIRSMQRLQLRQSKYLWLYLSLERVKLLLELKQDAFPALVKEYKSPLDEKTKLELQQNMPQGGYKLESLIEFMYEFIVLFVATAKDNSEFNYSNYPMTDCMELYLDFPEYKGPNIDFDDIQFPDSIPLSQVVESFYVILGIAKKHKRR